MRDKRQTAGTDSIACFLELTCMSVSATHPCSPQSCTYCIVAVHFIHYKRIIPNLQRHEQIQLGLLAIDRSNACPSTKAASDRAELRGRPTDEADAASGCELPEIENSALKMRPISHEESVVALEVTTQPLSEERRVGSLTARGSHSISNEFDWNSKS